MKNKLYSKKNRKCKLNNSKKQFAGANNNYSNSLKKLFNDNNNNEIENNIEDLLTSHIENDIVLLTGCNNTTQSANNIECEELNPSTLVACNRNLMAKILRDAGYAPTRGNKKGRCIVRTKKGTRCKTATCNDDIICTQHLSMFRQKHPNSNLEMENVGNFFKSGQPKNK